MLFCLAEGNSNIMDHEHGPRSVVTAILNITTCFLLCV